jgi:hypothetical protein
MKTQIKRFSPHQNAKVFAVLMALGSLVFLVPFMLLVYSSAPKGSNTIPLFMFVFFPIFYLVFGYLMVAVGCWLYNVMFEHIGGIEYEARSDA